MNPSMRAAALVALLLISLTARAAAADPPKLQCATAFEDGQRLRMSGNLKLAVEKFESCAAPRCPALVQRECSRLLSAALDAAPTVEFELQFADGVAKRPVSLSIDDGEPEAYEGQLLRVNPGKRRFVFQCEGCATISRRISFAESDHKRKEVVLNALCVEPEVAASSSTLDSKARSVSPLEVGSTGPVAATGSAPLAPPRRPASRVPTPSALHSNRDAWLLGSGALVITLSGVGFVGFGLQARSGERSLASCAPECSAGRIAQVKRDYWMANASLTTGLVALAGAGIWWFAGRPRAESAHGRAAGSGHWSATLGAFSTVTRTF